MHILQVFNRRRDWGGEDLSIDDTARILDARGHSVSYWIQDNIDVDATLFAKIGISLSGIYSFESARKAHAIVQERQPDVVHVHNVYPLISPSALRSFRRMGVATVWHPHDQRPICATGLSLFHGAICEKCSNGHDYWCILRNCRSNICESTAYAIRNAFHRGFKVFQRYAHVTVVWSEFLRQRLLREGFHPERIFVVPHPVSISERAVDVQKGSYVAYLGRLSPEKGIRVILQAAAKIPHIPFRIAGDPKSLNKAISIPPNIELVGWVERTHISEFLGKARLTILPSVCFETFPTAALEAMGHGIPVVGSNIGGIPEAVLDGKTGLLFEAGNSEQLAEKIQLLWDSPRFSAELGMQGREMVAKQYSAAAYYDSLIRAYKLAMEISVK